MTRQRIFRRVMEPTMIDNPFLPSPTGAAAWSEGFVKGLVSQSTPAPGPEIAAEDDDAFTQGVAAGAAAQTTGLEPPRACIAAVPDDETFEDAKGVVEGLETATEVIRGIVEAGLAGALTGLAVSLVLFIVTTPGTTVTPSTPLSDIGQPLLDRLAAMGVGSLQLYCGVGVDSTDASCTYKISSLFLQQDQAQAAITAMNRSTWVLLSWRTDQCGSFTIVDTAG